MSHALDGWVVLERRRVSPQVDAVHGPYSDCDEAAEYAVDLADAEPDSVFAVAYWTEIDPGTMTA